MGDTKERKAFRHSLIIVGVAVLGVFGMFACLAGLHSGNWSIYTPVILVSGLLVFPLVYFSYKRGSQRPFTRRHSTLSAMLCGALAIGYFVSAIVDPKTGWGLARAWILGAVWMFAAFVHLRRAYKRKEESPSLAQ
jgi:peptidoglycan/LPS O-acetylase OafA/YrhL